MVEAEPLKARAAARARATMAAGPLQRTRKPRLPRVAVPIAAVVIAGLAAAGAGLILQPPSPDEPARPALVPRPSSVPREGRPGAPAPRPAEARVALPPPTSAAPAPSSPVPDAPRREAPEAKRNEGASRSGSARQYALELEILEPARQAIARGNYAAALEAVARHEQSFPSGQLAEERSALRVRALWSSGRRAEARAAAAVFASRYPRSGLLAWMRETPSRP
ncbi:MAG: hypothetical protein K0R38_6184 [Polyangiaceae bacterium]|jgi:hypothetical protein|nr:hypothetical protein [Polyangiaceae bacterium]